MSSSPFLNFIRQELRLRGYSLKTEKSYLYWIKYFIRFHKLQHPQNMGAEEVRAFLSFLAVEQNVAINTQKSALNALAFLYNKLLEQPLGDLGFQHAKQGRRLPIVLAPNETQKILNCLNERDHLIFSLLYGSGLRISECLRIRIQDINLDQGSLAVRCSKMITLTDMVHLYPLRCLESTQTPFVNSVGCFYFLLHPSAHTL
ncbi:hypothetical protein MACH16_19040 [Marinomonas pontica]|uniref:Integron integrase n=1 Tax=Marinomonas pontica TaxID=264739 RepID=A0ABM8FDL6_9GAMM|nr:hypothetical protein MACH16_19040 [Marinomonas pontica]